MYFSEIQEDEPSSGLPTSLLPATKGQVQQTATDIQRQLEVSDQSTLHVSATGEKIGLTDRD